jgi:hypothetical protein
VPTCVFITAHRSSHHSSQLITDQSPTSSFSLKGMRNLASLITAHHSSQRIIQSCMPSSLHSFTVYSTHRTRRITSFIHSLSSFIAHLDHLEFVIGRNDAVLAHHSSSHSSSHHSQFITHRIMQSCMPSSHHSFALIASLHSFMVRRSSYHSIYMPSSLHLFIALIALIASHHSFTVYHRSSLISITSSSSLDGMMLS